MVRKYVYFEYSMVFLAIKILYWWNLLSITNVKNNEGRKLPNHLNIFFSLKNSPLLPLISIKTCSKFNNITNFLPFKINISESSFQILLFIFWTSMCSVNFLTNCRLMELRLTMFFNVDQRSETGILQFPLKKHLKSMKKRK